MLQEFPYKKLVSNHKTVLLLQSYPDVYLKRLNFEESLFTISARVDNGRLLVATCVLATKKFIECNIAREGAPCVPAF